MTFDPQWNCPTHFVAGDPACPACQAKQPRAMTDHAEREEELRRACIDLYWEACTSQSIAERRVEEYRLAVLASARERVEAVSEENEDVGNTHDELFARGFNAGRRAAIAALSEDT